uniref:Apoptosis inducing factor mitochondria associated 4 n=1 Tax=Nothobranchius furzeri TaxID=105023 RepID=A0A8C6NHS2_NOTFU
MFALHLARMNKQQEAGQSEKMREVAVDDQKVLLVRIQGQYSAVGSRCSHYSAPLIKGALVGDRVRCPFHGACFNVRTGDIEEYPGLDSIPSYKVNHTTFVANCLLLFKNIYIKKVKIVIYYLLQFNYFRIRKRFIGIVSEQTIHKLGTCFGPASLVCAETLRQNCYPGHIVIVTKDSLPPIDKPKLSKAMNLESSSILLRSGDFYQQYAIEMWMGKEVVSVHPPDKVVKMSDGTSKRYDQLLIATGSRPLSCPGSDLKGVHLLQSYDDAKEIHSSSVGQRAVVIGASFIGMEVASYLSDKATSVALVGSASYPFEKSLGPEIGKMTMAMLEEKNVKFFMNDRVTEIRGENGKVKNVVLSSGAVLEADVVIAGIGHFVHLDVFSTLFFQYMRTNIPDIFSAGDVASFPLSIRGDQQVNIGHWQMSHSHGKVAALNMLKKPTKIESVPFFWSALAGKSIRYTGYGEGYTEILVKGKVEERKFLAFYIKDEEVVAAASLMFDPAVAQVAELMAEGKNITKKQAQSDDLSWLQM